MPGFLLCLLVVGALAAIPAEAGQAQAAATQEREAVAVPVREARAELEREADAAPVREAAATPEREAAVAQVREAAAEPAPVLNKELTLSLQAGGRPALLLDGSTSTKVALAEDSSLEISCPEGTVIHGLYLVWDKPPGPWMLHSPEGEEEWGAHGFLHEYVPISGRAENLRLSWSGGGKVLCDIHVFGDGLLPEWVQTWKLPHERADILLLPTHGDDEHLFFGGTMPYYAGELGLKVQVSYLVNHWTEPYRPHEILDGLWAVGVEHYPVMGPYPDYYSGSLAHARSIYAEDEMTAYQIALLRQFRPLVVIGHDINGEYGHGVHMLNTATLMEALEASGDPLADIPSAERYGTWDVPKAYLHLYQENHMLMDWDRPLERFGGKTAFEMAERGFSFHKSQQQWFSVRKTGVHDCRSFGLYRSDRGADLVGGDFMEGLAPYPSAPYPYDEGVLRRLYQTRYGMLGIGHYLGRGAN